MTAVAGAAGSASPPPLLRRIARAVLAWAVGDAPTGWGAAVLHEFDEVPGSWPAVRWAAGGVRVAWRDRLARRAAARSVPPPRLRTMRRLTAIVVAVGVVAALGVSQFLLTVTYVPSVSMEPTLWAGDRVLVDRLTVRVGNASVGDVVVFRHRVESVDTEFARRVVGVGGDRIDCRSGRVHRNGEPLAEPYLPTGVATTCDPVTVAAGSLYVLGDQREISADSRQFGVIPAASLTGRVVLRVWPPDTL